MSHRVRLAVNGYGRIGRCVVRALHESPLRDHMQVVVINEPSNLDTMEYLTQYDSTHGVFPGQVERDENGLVLDGHPITVLHRDTPEAVDWHGMSVDMMLECSGQYSTRKDLSRFIDAGCPRVLLSHPGGSAEDVDRTVVYGINHEALQRTDTLVSNASCTTNAVVPLLAFLNKKFGLKHAFLTTLHSVMNDQPVIDGYHHPDLRRTRSAMQSIVPVSTGLAQGVERLLPELNGKIQAKAIRAPIPNVSAIDVMVQLQTPVTRKALNGYLADKADGMPGLMAFSDRPHASVDFNHDTHSLIVDGSQTTTNNDGFANLLIWFDNEWGFANRMLDIAWHWAGILSSDKVSS